MFSKENPASSVKEVVLLLMSEHTNNFIYRGQTKDYGSFIPSGYRKNEPKNVNGHFLFREEKEASDVEKYRNAVFYTLIKKYGPIVGSYLAQQYLAFSNCIDVTENVKVAAFFATMCYPDYLKPLDDDSQIGVIYRFDSRQFPVNTIPSGVKDNPFSIDKHEKYTPVYKEAKSVSNISFETFQTNDFNQNVFKNLMILKCNLTRYSDVKPFLDTVERNHLSNHGVSDLINNIWFTRPYRQFGGIIQPQLLLNPSDDSEPDPNVLEGLIGFENIYNKYGMEAFYFRHTGKQNNFNREELWPSVKNDLTFATLILISKATLKIFELPDSYLLQMVDIGFKNNDYDICFINS